MPEADGARVLVTRSEPGASELAAALNAAGFCAVQCPVLEVEPIVEPAHRSILAHLDRFDVVIFLSAHAARIGLDAIDAALPRRPSAKWIAVGTSTAAVLAERGIEATVPDVESSEGILALPLLARPENLRVLIVAGVGGRHLLAESLTARGAVVERLEVYRRVATPIERVLSVVASPNGIAFVIVSSSDGGRAFATLWRSIGGADTIPVIVPSPRVAADLQALRFRRVIVSGGAGPAAVLASLARLTGKT